MAPGHEQNPMRTDDAWSTVADGHQPTTVTRQRMGGYTPLKRRAAASSAPSVSEGAPVEPRSAEATESEESPAEVAPAAREAVPEARGSVVERTTDGPARPKQRMGGYTPLKRHAAASSAPSVSEGAPVEPRSTETAVSEESQAEVAPAARESASEARDSAAEGATNEPSRPKQRMGGAAAPIAPVASGGRQRMGAQSAPQAEAPDATASDAPAESASRESSSGAKVGQEAQPAAAKPTQPSSQQRARPGRPAWLRSAVSVAAVVALALLIVLCARWLRTLDPVQGFIATYDGHSTLPQGTPEGFPAWLGWQHFLNMLFLVLIVRTGLEVRMGSRPPGYWQPRKGSFFSPKGNTPKKVSLYQWLHQMLDVAWVVNGIIFVVLLVATGHWMRIVPTSWDVIPNMASTALQYASLDWPAEQGWVHYNALQMVSYSLIVYVAAPLAILTGWRMSTWWPTEVRWLNQIYPAGAARALHFTVMLFFVAFTLVHVFLVFFTGALRNLNHMYTSRDVVDWWGLVIFLLSVAVIAAAWFLTKPMFTTPLANRTGTVSKN